MTERFYPPVVSIDESHQHSDAELREALHRDIAVVTSDHCYEIRKLHRQVPTNEGQRCLECRKPWPCPTIQILDRKLT